MDVIALAQAGFPGAVAPLGTALTEEHLEEIWKLTPEPVICFDGDAAGQRAALKTVEMALAHLSPEHSLRLLRLPPKDDPDSLIKRDGAQSFAGLLEKAEPLSAALYPMLAGTQSGATPEARAALRARLEEAAGKIPDKTLASEYRAVLLDRFFAARRAGKPLRPGFPASGFPGKRGAPFVLPFTQERTPPVAADAEISRARVMLAILFDHPELLHDVDEAFAHVVLPPEEDVLRAALHQAAARRPLDSEKLFTHLEQSGLAGKAREVQALAQKDYRLPKDASPAEAADAWWSLYGLMEFSIDMLRSQRDDAQAYWLAHQDDLAAWERLKTYNELLTRARTGAEKT
jgi:DNA primase